MESARKRLKTERETSRFEWSNWGDDGLVRTQVTATQSEADTDVGGATQLLREHDYHSSSRVPPATLSEALERIQALEGLVSSLGISGHLLDRWCVSDEDFKYFTRFPSKNIFFVFWKCVEPSASRIGYWSKANTAGKASLEKSAVRITPERKLPLVDEFFMFCLHVAVGLREGVLAGIFGLSTSTVTQILIAWSNYLYLVLGTVRIWMTREQVTQTMPAEMQNRCPNVRAIVGCVELKCENTATTFLRSEELSNQKSCANVKALIGVAPCGAITFASNLFTASISDRELTRQSGVLDLLEPGDELVADKDFVIEDLLEDVGGKLAAPSNLNDNFSTEDPDKARAVAELCILFEKVIRRIKAYQIWDSPLPSSMAGRMNQMWSCCCMMANYQVSVGHDVKVTY